MLLTILLKLSLANYFIYSICLFFVFAWVVIFTDFFVKSDQVKGSQKGQANLLKTNEGEITSDDQKVIDDKLSSMGQVMKNEMLDDRIQQNFVMPTRLDESSFHRETKEAKENVIDTTSEIPIGPDHEIITQNNSSQSTHSEKENDNVPAFAVEDKDFNDSDDSSPSAFTAYSDGGLGAMDDNYVEEVTFVSVKGSPNIEKGLSQTICKEEWQDELDEYLAEFQQMDSEQKTMIEQQGQKIFDKIKMKQTEEHHKLKIDTGSSMYKQFTNFENIATSDFITQEELFNLNVINLTGLEIDTEITKNVFIKEVPTFNLSISKISQNR